MSNSKISAGGKVDLRIDEILKKFNKQLYVDFKTVFSGYDWSLPVFTGKGKGFERIQEPKVFYSKVGDGQALLNTGCDDIVVYEIVRNYNYDYDIKDGRLRPDSKEHFIFSDYVKLTEKSRHHLYKAESVNRARWSRVEMEMKAERNALSAMLKEEFGDFTDPNIKGDKEEIAVKAKRTHLFCSIRLCFYCKRIPILPILCAIGGHKLYCFDCITEKIRDKEQSFLLAVDSFFCPEKCQRPVDFKITKERVLSKNAKPLIESIYKWAEVCEECQELYWVHEKERHNCDNGEKNSNEEEEEIDEEEDEEDVVESQALTSVPKDEDKEIYDSGDDMPKADDVVGDLQNHPLWKRFKEHLVQKQIEIMNISRERDEMKGELELEKKERMSVLAEKTKLESELKKLNGSHDDLCDKYEERTNELNSLQRKYKLLTDTKVDVDIESKSRSLRSSAQSSPKSGPIQPKTKAERKSITEPKKEKSTPKPNIQSKPSVKATPKLVEVDLFDQMMADVVQTVRKKSSTDKSGTEDKTTSAAKRKKF